MKHVNQQMIAADIRRPHLQRYKSKLRETLQSPALSPQDRDRISKELRQAGKPRNYSDVTIQPGSVNPGPLREGITIIDLLGHSDDALTTFTHTDLYRAAQRAGLPVASSDTKAQIVKAIIRFKGESK